MQFPSFEEVLQRLVDMRLAEADSIWNQASLIFVLIEHYKAKAGDIASQINCSSQHVLDMARTFRAFPEEGTRARDAPFTIHKLCARTDDPQGWLEKAVADAWSVRELQKALRGEAVAEPLREAQAVWHKVEKILQAGGPGAEWLETRWDEWRKEKAGG